MNRLFHIIRDDRRLGLRIIKTGIAVTVCIVISNLLKLDQPFLAVIATVLSMGKSIDMSVRSGKNKMIGVLIGAALGCGFAVLALTMHSPANAGLCGVGIIAVLYLCQLFSLNGAAALTSFAFAAVMFGSISIKPWVYAITCAENAIIGIAISVLINLIIMPPNYAEEVKRAYALLREKISSSVEDVSEKHPIDVKEIETVIERLARNVRLYVSEARFLRGDDDEVFSISCKVSAYKMILDELKAIDAMELANKENISDELQTVYRYHMNRMTQLLEGVSEKSTASAAPKKK
ncbi:MAG TPA: aromatic acid exporter family protein [Caproicibacter sp.]|nr:aromatic acid exporter family protein [Caproicibacter sp.]